MQGQQSDEIKRELIFRHIAWLTSLRYQLRLTREWEHTEYRVIGKFNPEISEAYYDQLEEEVKGFICHEEFAVYEGKTNMAAQLLNTQSVRLQELKDAGYFEDFRHMELFVLIKGFYDSQGASERIKNFPFPRQYASVALWMTLIFSLLIPFGLLNVFHNQESHTVWLTIPFSALLIWVFYLMEMIGDFSENPFEGTYNDVPITTIARGIEIDLKEMINEKDIPKPMTAENGFLM